MNKDERNPFRRAKSSVPWYGRGSASTFPPPRCPKPQEFAANREGEVEDDLGAPAEPFSAWFWLGRSLALPPKSSFPAAPSIEFLEPRILLHAHPTPIPSIDTNTALLSGQHVLTAAQIPGPVEAAVGPLCRRDGAFGGRWNQVRRYGGCPCVPLEKRGGAH